MNQKTLLRKVQRSARLVLGVLGALSPLLLAPLALPAAFAAVASPGAESALESELRQNDLQSLLRLPASPKRLDRGRFQLLKPTPTEWLNALETLSDEGLALEPRLAALPALSRLESWPLQARLKLLRLRLSSGIALSPRESAETGDLLREAAHSSSLTPGELFEAARLREEAVLEPELDSALSAALASDPTHASLFVRLRSPLSNRTVEEVRDLYFHLPAADDYAGGTYAKTPRAFVFCRRSRIYPCLTLLKTASGSPLRTGPQGQGPLWSQPALGLSKFGKRYDEFNGYTPQGVYTIDGVIQDQATESFGRYSRIVMNFLLPSTTGASHQTLLPPSHRDLDWWRESWVAQNMGRSDFRMHGTGKRSEAIDQPYHPLVPTSGCIAARENTYGATNYRDQRRLLDAWMTAMQLKPSPANELKIRGLLYVVELDDQAAAVTLEDLKAYGID